MKNKKDKITQYKREIFYSMFISLFLLFAGYFSNNLPLFTGENLKMYARMESLNKWLGIEEEECDSVMYINTCFDKELIPAIKQYDVNSQIDTLGNIGITSRQDLYQFLNLLKDVNYKYLIIDLTFSKDLHSNNQVFNELTGDSTNIDILLFDLIKKMKRVVIARPLKEDLLDKELEPISANAYYYSTATETNFVRYHYFDDIPSIPLTVYNNLRAEHKLTTIKCQYPFGCKSLSFFSWYNQGWDLCYNSLFLDFRILDEEGLHIGENFNTKNGFTIINEIPDIGRNIVDKLNSSRKDTQEWLKDYCKDKYVIVGNMYEDLHDTYAGPQQGPVILYKAIKALENEVHIVSLWQMLILFIIYFFIALFILARKSIYNWIPFVSKTKYGLLHFVLDVFSFTAVFFIYHFIEYMTHRVSFSFIIPVIIFTALKFYVIIRKEYHMKKSITTIIIALLAGLFLSFKPKENDDTLFQVDYCSSTNILINNKPVEKNQIISLNDCIDFTKVDKDVEKFIRIHPLENFIYKKGNKQEIWHTANIRRIVPSDDKQKFDLKWYIIKRGAQGKSAINSGSNEIFISGDSAAIAIDHTLVDNTAQKQYYKFTIIDGEYKNLSFKATNDDEYPVIWLYKKDFEDIGIECSKEQILKCRIEYYNYKVLADSTCKIIIYNP